MSEMKYLRILDSKGQKIAIRAYSGNFEGASTGRRLGSWGLSGNGPTSSVTSSISSLRSRSRELIRNNPLIDGAIESFVASVVGTGINPRWQIKDPALRGSVQDLWDDWVEDADYNGLQSFYGIQDQIMRGLIDAGEAFVQTIYPPQGSSIAVPLQLRVFEADHLDENYTTVLDNGNKVRMGIELNNMGQRVAYHIWPEHPGESYSQNDNFVRVRVPANNIYHIYRQNRAGQLRGRPWLASVILKMHDLDQYDDAELVRKKGAAMFGGFLTEEFQKVDFDDPSRFLGREEEDDENGQTVIAFEPGTFPRLPAGLKVEFSKPSDVGDNYEKWMKKQLRDIARGIGVTYEQLTGDLSNVNFSSIRVGLNEIKRRVKQIQQRLIIFQFCRRAAIDFLDQAVLSGAVSIPGYFTNPRQFRKVAWNPDVWESANPKQDAETDLMEIKGGLASRTAKVAGRGGDIETVDREQVSDHLREEKNDLIYDTNLESCPPKAYAVGSMKVEDNTDE
jgi:lambda family phage portal protein